jgi:2,4-dienoyl-CoA reductase-like NADH-dependent reductase (Old Yellow Enzyme family)
MFLPLRLRGLTLANRVVVSPMAQYMAKDGLPGDWHLVHYGSRALGGAGLVYTEMTCVSPEGRITPGCTGLWNTEQRDAWRRIVDFVHGNSPVAFCLQLGHSGRKGSTQLGWQEMDRPLATGNWPICAPSPLPYLEGVNQVPVPMTRSDMDRVRDEFVRSAELGNEAGFDMLELHMAHGYLLASFISPLTNLRDDEYGGPLANRLRFPLEVLAAVRAAWPAEKPLSVRISASDWAEGGLAEDELVALAAAMKAGGADLIDVSSGQTVPWQQPVYGRMWQTPFADRIRNEVGIATIAVRQHLRGRPRQFDHRVRPCRPVRACATPPRESVLDARSRGTSGVRGAVVAGSLSLRQEPARAQPAARRAGGGQPSMSAAPQGRLAGRHALVTGAGRGIGLAIAQALAAEGARVSMLGRDMARLAAAARSIGAEDRVASLAGRRHEPGRARGRLPSRSQTLRRSATPCQQRGGGGQRPLSEDG